MADSHNGTMRRGQKKEAFWRRHMQIQATSAQSIQAYCQAHRLGYASFGWWRRAGESRRMARTFIPVTVAPPPAYGQQVRLEIVLSRDRRVRVTGGVNWQYLVEVLMALAACRETGPC